MHLTPSSAGELKTLAIVVAHPKDMVLGFGNPSSPVQQKAPKLRDLGYPTYRSFLKCGSRLEDRDMPPRMSFYMDIVRLGRSKVLRALGIEEPALDERPIKAPHTGAEVLGQSSYDNSGPRRG